MGARAVEAVDAVRIGHKNRIGATDKKSAFHHADDSSDALVQSCRIGDAAEIAIKNAIAAVGHKGLDRRQAHARADAEHFEALARCLESEGDHFDGDRCVRSEPVRQLAAVDHDRETVTRSR